MPRPLVTPSPSLPSVSIALPAGAITLIAPRPAFVSQRTSLDILGIPPERFLAMVRAPAFPLRVVATGKLRMVETETMIAYLREIAGSPANLNGDASPVESGPAPAVEPSREDADADARKLGASLGFTFNEPPAPSAPASRRRRKA